MKKINCFLFLTLFPLFLFCQQVEIKGKVYDGITFHPIFGASIYNMNTKKFTFSDMVGNFSIIVSVNDTIIASKSIYKQNFTIITEEDIRKKEIELLFYYKPIILREVIVYAFKGTYEDFKRDMVTSKLPAYYKIIEEGTNLSAEEKQKIVQSTKEPNLIGNTVLVSPISALYNRFSRKVKMENLYLYLIDKQNEINNLSDKYNRDIVKKITGLEEEELLNFMMYCRFSYYDLIAWSPEQIIVNIKKKFNDYEYYKLLEEEKKGKK